MHIAHLSERNGLILEEFLRMCSPQMRDEFENQNSVVLQLTDVAYAVKRAPKADRVRVLHEGLAALQLPQRFTLALSPRLEACGLVVNKCRVMSSKKVCDHHSI